MSEFHNTDTHVVENNVWMPENSTWSTLNLSGNHFGMSGGKSALLLKLLLSKSISATIKKTLYIHS